ncbi:MAG: Ig-like domain-containing protein [Pseudomonadota bacterium]
MSSTSQIKTQFSGISNTSSYPPHNGLAVGPSAIVMAEGSRIEWTDLNGGTATLDSVYSFFSPLGASATNSLFDPRCIYDSASGRFIVIMENIGSNGTVSNIDIAVSKDSNPADGWYFASLNTSLTLNGQLSSSDRPTISVDANNIYISAPQYDVNISGYAGTETWVIGKTAGPGGGLYGGGTMTVVANEVTPSSQGVFAVTAGNNGETYYACDYSTGSQIVAVVQAYNTATGTFGPSTTIALGNIDQGGSYTAQQQGTTLLLDAGDKRISGLTYANGFLWGVCELQPPGSSVPLVHWFKIDVSNPNSPALVAQGDISGASLGSNVATFNGSIAVDGNGDVLINFTASGPNMYPSDYYVYQAAGAAAGSFSAPVLYQASSSFFDSGDGSSVQRWGAYSTAIADPNNPNGFWISNEYVANGWWQTAVSQIGITNTNSPTVASIVTSGAGISNGTGDLNAGKTVTLTVNFSSAVTVNTTAGSPTLLLNDGGTASYTGGSGSSALVFSYVVAPGQNTPDLVVSSLALNGATIQDSLGDNADLSGAINNNPAGTLQIDTTPPAAPTGLTLDPSTDSGAKGDNITNFTQVTIDGSAEAGSTVTLYDSNGTTVLGTGIANAAGMFSITTSPLANGTHTITATATDAAGNIGPASSPDTITIDTVPPAAPTGLSLDPSTDSGIKGDGITSFSQVKIDGTAEPGSTVTLYDSNGTMLGTGPADPTTGAFSIMTSPLALGVHSITATATDAAGNTGPASTAYLLTEISPPPAATSEVETQFSGISDKSSYPPHNALAVGPNYVVTLEGARIEWSNLSGGATKLQSVYQFFKPLGSTATNALFDPRVVYDSANGRYVVTMDNIGSGGTISNIAIAVSKDSNPNDGWTFASLNTSLTINGQLTSSDTPVVSVDGSNVYITAPQYNVKSSGWQGTEVWVIGDTVGAGGGLYGGGTMTITANEVTSPNQGIYRVVAGNNGKTYYASSYSAGSQIMVTVQTYDAATKTFGAVTSIALGNINQGGSYTAQQQGTSLLLDAGDKRIQNLAYSNGFLYGVTEERPPGSSVPLVHWFKIDVSNPNSPTLAAQGNISGASLGSNVATFNGSIAADAAGDILINFTASGPNMYPSDYYVFQAANSTSFSAPIAYQASTGFFNSGNGSSVQRWGINSSAIADPNAPNGFWISNEYVANGWWQTAIAEVQVNTTPEAPTLTLGSSALTLPAGGSVALPISVAAADADDTVSVTITGLTSYETVTDGHDATVFSGSSVTLTAAEVSSGLTLHSSYGGSDHPVNTLVVTASNTTPNEGTISVAQTITVTDPPVISASVTTTPTGPGQSPQTQSTPAAIGTLSPDQLIALTTQFAAAGFAGAATSSPGTGLPSANVGLDTAPLVLTPHTLGT